MASRALGVVLACGAAVCATCIPDHTRVCGDGADAIRCPQGDACGISDGKPVCVGANPPHVCGDGVVDPPEQCDPVGSDLEPCSPDCLSNLKCGNGIVDAVAFEQCDDGNTSSHDGCDSHCLVEIPRWIEIGDVDPVTRWDPAMAYDPRNGELVMFGGAIDGVDELGDTWVRSHGSWSQVPTLAGPSPRTGATMAYDADDARIYLYGGTADGALLNETWRWDGATWERLMAVTDKALESPHMAFDPGRHMLVLVGQPQSVQAMQLLYYELGSAGDWEPQRMTLAPPARVGEVLAYDPRSQAIVLFGGEKPAAPEPFTLNDTWTYDGAWHPGSAAPAQTPDPAALGELADDGTALFLIGAAGSNGATWRYAGSGAWSPTTTAVDAVADGALAADPDEGLVLFGGYSLGGPTGQTPVDEPATFVGSASAFTIARSPELALASPAGALDLVRGRPMMYGRVTGSNATRAAYELVGSRWVRVGPGSAGDIDAGSPPATLEVAGVYDEQLGSMMFFGGRLAGGSGTVQRGTYLWTGSAQWQEVVGGGLEPDPRRDHAMAYDASRDVTVMFGGRVDGAALDDVWEWGSGGTLGWSPWADSAQAAAGPVARYGHSMAYDRARREIVMFGGRDGSDQALDDTWRLTAAGWAEVALPDGAPRPSARAGAALAWDPARRRLVLFGGESDQEDSDTWEWDGISWSRLAIPGPPPRTRALLAGTRDGLVLAGGGVLYDSPATEVQPDLWLLRYDSDSASDTCVDNQDDDRDGLALCADPDCWLVCAPACEPGDPCP